MAADLLAVRNARQHVQSYADQSDELIARHGEAMDCRDCEAFLQMGIDAFAWLIRADRVIRLNVYRGEADFDPASELAMQELCVRWLKPLAFAEKWIAIQQERKYDIENLDEFRYCAKEMVAIVEANAVRDDSLPAPIAQLRDLAVQENRDGQTSEFV